ncbi:ABC transporter permease subunit [Beduinella massiliensis]|uniref:ABC transporter permease subunit n=1 Tax=Beduinella massiliensis TaxID=1852363 RepID=UPI000C82F210
MLRYILKRLMAGILTIWVIITITFVLMHAVPGNPFQMKEENKTPPEVMARLEQKYGLDKPLWQQYLRYLSDILHGDFGISFKKADTSVNEIIDRGFPASAKVGVIAVVVSVIMGLALGIVSAIKRGKWMDWFSMIFATIGISIPAFVISVLMLYIFCYYWKVLPSFGLTSWKHFILPVACLAFSPTAYIARLTRSSMLEVMRADYIRTARAKGISEKMVILRHALRNAILPVVTYLGPLVASMLTGSFVVERLFSIPGIGREYVDGISSRDYSVILGMTAFFGIFVIVANLVVDILYGVIDPRVKLND